MKTYRLSPQASTELDAIADFISADNPVAALHLVQRFERVFQMLADFPRAGHEHGRAWRYPVDPYVVEYRRTRTGVEIGRIVDGRRDLAKALAKRPALVKMTLDLLTAEQRQRIAGLPLDIEIEKHELRRWGKLTIATFLHVDGSPVLVPVEDKHLPHITVLRALRSGETMTAFLKDTTYYGDADKGEGVDGGFLLFCQRYPGADFFVTTLYHTVYMVQPRPFAPL